MTDPTAALRDELFKEMRGRIKEDDTSLPSIHTGWAYYTRFREGGEYAIYARKPAEDAYNPDAEETILLDGDAMAKGEDYFAFGDIEASPDHKTLAYGTDTKGSEYYEIRVKNIETGEDTGVLIENGYGDFEWSATGKAIFWVLRDENNRPAAVYQRDLATGADTLIYEEKDPGFFVGLETSESEEVIFIGVGNHTTSEYHWFPANELNPTLRLVAPRVEDNQYSVTHWDDAFYISTNSDGAVHFKLVNKLLSFSFGKLLLDFAYRFFKNILRFFA